MRVALALTLAGSTLGAAAVAAQPVITGASPASITLRSGGAAVEVTLAGTRLDLITEFQVLAQRRPSTALQVTAAPSARTRLAGMQRTITIEALGTAGPGTYELRAVAGSQLLPVPITITVEAAQLAVASVSGVSPSRVRLVAGAPAQTITLSGNDLNYIGGVWLERNGAIVSDVKATLEPSNDPTRRAVTLSASPDARGAADPLELVVRTAEGSLAVTARPGLDVELFGAALISDDAIRTGIDRALSGGAAVANSCGPSDAARRLAIEKPNIDYRRIVPVPRLERRIIEPQLILSFLEDHTLDPTDAVTGEVNALELARTAHPSPVPHSVGAVRLCMDTVQLTTWALERASAAAGVPQAAVTVRLGDVRFRSRGMPADPSGQVLASTVGMGWGDPVTDKELPDRRYENVRYEVLLTLRVADGRIEYGAVDVKRLGNPARWDGTFLGPGLIRSQMEDFAEDVMRGVDGEIRRVFESSETRDRIAGMIMAVLRSEGASQVVGVEQGSDGQLRFLLR